VDAFRIVGGHIEKERFIEKLKPTHCIGAGFYLRSCYCPMTFGEE
jgi:hypothetical protein